MVDVRLPRPLRALFDEPLERDRLVLVVFWSWVAVTLTGFLASPVRARHGVLVSLLYGVGAGIGWAVAAVLLAVLAGLVRRLLRAMR